MSRRHSNADVQTSFQWQEPVRHIGLSTHGSPYTHTVLDPGRPASCLALAGKDLDLRERRQSSLLPVRCPELQ